MWHQEFNERIVQKYRLNVLLEVDRADGRADLAEAEDHLQLVLELELRKQDVHRVDQALEVFVFIFHFLNQLDARFLVSLF